MMKDASSQVHIQPPPLGTLHLSSVICSPSHKRGIQQNFTSQGQPRAQKRWRIAFPKPRWLRLISLPFLMQHHLNYDSHRGAGVCWLFWSRIESLVPSYILLQMFMLWLTQNRKSAVVCQVKLSMYGSDALQRPATLLSPAMLLAWAPQAYSDETKHFSGQPGYIQKTRIPKSVTGGLRASSESTGQAGPQPHQFPAVWTNAAN